MGEIADDMIDNFIGEGGWGFGRRRSVPMPPTCKRCGARGLEWIHTGTRWALADDKGLHVCKPSADDFDVIAC